MKRNVTIAVILSLLLLACPGAFAADLKIAVVDKQILLRDSLAGKNAIVQLEQVQKDKQVEIKAKEDSIRQLEQEISVKGIGMTDKAKEELEMKHQQQMRELNRFFQDAQEDLKRRQMALLKPISDELNQVIGTYGKQHDLDLVLDKRTPGLIYAAETADITATILELYNQRYQEKKPE